MNIIKICEIKAKKQKKNYIENFSKLIKTNQN